MKVKILLIFILIFTLTGGGMVMAKGGDLNKPSTTNDSGNSNSSMQGMDMNGKDKNMDMSGSNGSSNSNDMQGMDMSGKDKNMDMSGSNGSSNSNDMQGMDMSGKDKNMDMSGSNGSSNSNDMQGMNMGDEKPIKETPPSAKILGTYAAVNGAFILIGIWNKWFRRKGGFIGDSK